MGAEGSGPSLTVLGAGSILPRPGYGCSGHAIRATASAPVTLLDCGPGTIRALGGAGIDLAEVERVVISHFHPDHFLDLFALFFARRNPAVTVGPLEVLGPVGLDGLVRDTVRGLGRWGSDPSAVVTEVPVDTRGRGGFSRGELEFACVRTRHTQESLAWRVTFPSGHGLVYTGDTGEEGDVAALATGTDLFLAECSFPDDQAVPKHLTPSSAARLAQAAGAKCLFLTHFYPALDPAEAVRVAGQSFSGAIRATHDGMCTWLQDLPGNLAGSGPPA